jgi:hypothetical protein
MADPSLRRSPAYRERKEKKEQKRTKIMTRKGTTTTTTTTTTTSHGPVAPELSARSLPARSTRLMSLVIVVLFSDSVTTTYCEWCQLKGKRNITDDA